MIWLLPAAILLICAYVMWKNKYALITLTLLNTAIFIYLFITSDKSFLMDYTVNTYQWSLQSYITYQFIHYSPLHFFGNILVMIMATTYLEQDITSRNYVLVYLISGVVSASVFSIMHLSDKYMLLGASGAIFGLLGFMFVRFPERKIPMFLGPILMPAVKVKYAVLFLFIFEVILTFTMTTDGVAHIGHVAGAIAGIILGNILPKRHADAEGIKIINQIEDEELREELKRLMEE